ncbi:dephospho-CoA kinase, partial [Candidatus Uhrbacteria bacterium]|nr:dephospho-CoA kinase [Candidatus Uhrbacteria bacterium]
LLDQYRVGITGEIASGKSKVAEDLVAAARKAGLPSVHINVDEILRELYDEDSVGAHIVRDELAKRFGAGVLANGGKTVNRPALAAIVFDVAAYADRKFVVNLTMPHVYRLYRKALAHARGLVVVEWARMAEMSMGAMTNHNVIVVSSPDRDKFIAARGLDAERVAAMSRLQFTASEKKILLESAARAARSGDVVAYENRFRTDLKNPDPALLHLLDYLIGPVFPGLQSLKK